MGNENTDSEFGEMPPNPDLNGAALAMLVEAAKQQQVSTPEVKTPPAEEKQVADKSAALSSPPVREVVKPTEWRFVKNGAPFEITLDDSQSMSFYRALTRAGDLASFGVLVVKDESQAQVIRDFAKRFPTAQIFEQ